MPIRPILVSAFVMVLAGGGGVLSGCSSSSPQDMNKNTDVGVGFIPPDGSTTQVTDAGIDADTAGTDAADTSLVSADLADTNASDDAAGAETSTPDGG
jgi:hypothetical protein